MSGQVNRRVFVKRAAFGAGAWWILHNSRSALSFAANEKLNLAVVGVGNPPFAPSGALEAVTSVALDLDHVIPRA
jgi:hypothetical protein